jgi:hypothetical protein
MSKLETITIDTPSGSNTMQIGSTNTATINLGVSGDTINVPAGVTIANAGTATGFGTSNTPAFSAIKTSNQSISHNVATKVTFDTELYDSDSAFSSDRFTVPSGKAGKYMIGSLAKPNASGDLSEHIVYLYVNGAFNTANKSVYAQINKTNETTYTLTTQFNLVLDLAAGDYCEVYSSIYSIGGASGLSIVGSTSNIQTYFYGYRIDG